MRLAVHISLKGKRNIYVEYWWESHNETEFTLRRTSLNEARISVIECNGRDRNYKQSPYGMLNQCDQPTQFGYVSSECLTSPINLVTQRDECDLTDSSVM
jgi:hypothetical protein